MTELSARLGLYVAIDRAAEDRERLSVAAAVIPVHRLDLDPSAVADRRGAQGWSRHLDDLIPDLEIKDLEASLEELGSLGDPGPLDQARRLKAVWALSRVVPETDRALLAGALVPLVSAGLAADDRRGKGSSGGSADGVAEEAADDDRQSPVLQSRAQDLAALLAESERFNSAEDWPELVQTALERRLISAEVADLASVGCDDWVTYVPVQHDGTVDVDPAARIISRVTNFSVGTHSLAEVEAALDPGRWPVCLGDFWCSMQSVPDTAHVLQDSLRRFQEVVGDCPNAPWFDPYLRFARRDLSFNGATSGFELQYDLCTTGELQALSAAGTTLTQDSRVEVDCGAVIVEWSRSPGDPNDHRIDIATSKTIRFAEPLPTGGIALLACISGWADKTRMMMAGCLGSGAATEEPA